MMLPLSLLRRPAGAAGVAAPFARSLAVSASSSSSSLFPSTRHPRRLITTSTTSTAQANAAPATTTTATSAHTHATPSVVFKPVKRIHSPLVSAETLEAVARAVEEAPATLATYWPDGFVPTLLKPLPWIREEQPAVQPAVWQPNCVRTGVVGTKVGMMQVWNSIGVRFAVTVVQLDSQVVQHNLSLSSRGLVGLQVGIGRAKLKRVSKPLMVQFRKAGVYPKRKLVQFAVSPDALLPVGFTLNARHFVPGQFVDVTGTTTGHGFTGAMKRWNFGGQPASHGVSITHRSLGSTGCRQDPGKVFKNKKMAGHMGVERNTQQNLQLYKIDPKRNLLFIKGALPGGNGSYVLIKDAVKRPFKTEAPPPYPTYVAKPGEVVPEEIVEPAGAEDPFAFGGA